MWARPQGQQSLITCGGGRYLLVASPLYAAAMGCRVGACLGQVSDTYLVIATNVCLGQASETANCECCREYTALCSVNRQACMSLHTSANGMPA